MKRLETRQPSLPVANSLSAEATRRDERRNARLVLPNAKRH